MLHKFKRLLTLSVNAKLGSFIIQFSLINSQPENELDKVIFVFQILNVITEKQPWPVTVLRSLEQK